MAIKLTVWGAVRRNDDRGEFALASEMACGPDAARGLVDGNAACIPGWHKANPVQRFAYFTVTEGEG
jgi:hypothetical protein